jgi:hypothetical protein
MKTRKPDIQHVVKRSLSPEPVSTQKYSYEVRERIAKKAYEINEQRGGRQGASWKICSKRRIWSAGNRCSP